VPEPNVTAEEVLWDIKVADAANLYKFYLNQEKKILGVVAVMLFLTLWEFMGGALSAYNPIPFLRINPMFMSAPSLIWKAALQLFGSGEIYNDLYVSGSEFFWGYSFRGSGDSVRHRWYKKWPMSSILSSTR